MSHKKLAEELRKSIIRKFDRGKIHSPFIDNVRGVDLEDMQLMNKLFKRIRFYYVLLTFIANMHELFH